MRKWQAKIASVVSLLLLMLQPPLAHARTNFPASIKQSKKIHSYVCNSPVMPSSFVWNGETVTISESWIDRASVDAPFVLSFCYTINTSKKRLNAPTFEPMESALFGGKLKLQSKTHVSNNCCTGVVHIWELYPKRKQTFEVRVLDSVGMSTVLVFDLSDFLQGAWDKDFMDRAKKNGILQGY